MYSSELMSINETVTCPFLTSCNVSLDLERETKNIGARRVGLLYLTSVFSYKIRLYTSSVPVLLLCEKHGGYSYKTK